LPSCLSGSEKKEKAWRDSGADCAYVDNGLHARASLEFPAMTERSIFLAVLEIDDPAERSAYLDRVCDGDLALRSQVEHLLKAHQEPGRFMERPASALVATVDEPIAERPGTVIGPYKLLEQIGEGGFGVVFMAEQTEPVRRKVALKVLKPGMDTRQVVARFEAERQALALMDHPNIAHILEGGETASGRPYFVMELVRGIPITDFCDQGHLSIRERLELFLSVCHAVQHAHQKGIIHRDIKPSNVLVTLHDDKAVVKVIDFGIAKATGQQLTDKTLFTNFAQMVGTPLYMSPEQAQMSGLDVDTRSDIYSLGVLLYELLTGTTPFDRDRLKTVGYDEIRRIIREEEPARPSTRMSTLAQAASTASANRQSDPKRLSQLLRGELDLIVMKALEKDRNRRYETASAFAADVERYLKDEPVLACPPSAWYRLRKFTRRKKSALAAAACVVLALAGIAGGMGWAVRDHAAREEEIARERLRQQAALDQKVEETLDTTAPLVDQGNWPEALAVVERADNLLAAAGRTQRPARLLELRQELTLAKRLEDIYRHPPLYLETSDAIVQGSGGLTVGVRRQHSGSEDDLFWNRQQDGIFAKAFRDVGIDIDVLAPREAADRIKSRRIHAGLVKAVDEWVVARQRARGGNDPGWKKLVEIASLADPDPWRNRCRAALLRRDRPALEELAGTVPVRQVPPATLWLLGRTLKEVGALEQAMALLRRAQQEHPTDLWINDTLGDFSWTAFQPPRTEDALRFYSIALSLRPTRPQLHMMVAFVLQRQKRLDEAVAYFRKAAELEPKSAGAHNDLGVALAQHKELDEAIAEFRTALELDPKSASAHTNLGVALYSQGKLEEAIACCRKAIELDPKIAVAHNSLGNALSYKRGQLDEAIAEYRTAIELNPKDSKLHSNLGRALLIKGKLEDAIACARKAIELDPKDGDAHNILGVALDEQNKLDQAIELDPKDTSAHVGLGNALWQQGKVAEANAELQKAIELDPKHALAHYNLGNALNRHGKLKEAITYYRKSIELDPKYAPAHNNLGIALQNQGKLDDAIACFRKAIELDPKYAPAHYNLGNALKKQGKLDDAFACFRKAIEFDPKYAPAHFNLGACLRQQGKLDDAIAEYRKAVALDPQYAAAYVNLGIALQNQGKLDDAIACFRKAIELDPKYAPAHTNLGNALQNQGKLDDAIACFRKAIELDPKYAPAHHNLGFALSKQRKLGEAIDCYKRAIALDPTNASPHYNLGTTLLAQNKLDEAIAELRKAIALDPRFGWAHNNLGRALQRQGKLDEAVTCYRKATEFGPNNPFAHNNLALIIVMYPDRKLGNAAEAVKMARKAVDLAPANSAYWGTLGAAHYRAGSWKEAVVAMEKFLVLSNGGDRCAWLFFLAMAHWQLGEKEKARTWFDRAVQWMDKNQPKNDALRRFRAEAAELMKIEPKQP
jgi:tetratricopeptide (TPR) repeat protein